MTDKSCSDTLLTGFTRQFCVKAGAKVSLRKIDPDSCDKQQQKKAEKITEKNLKRLRSLQELMYAEHKRGLIICLQALDAGGKDGVIRHVFSSMNPQGVKVHSFRAPTSLEADHDFLWRAHRDVPAKGEIAIFNRSHYEDVLVARVQKLVPKAVWSARYEQINDMEKILCENGTHIIKIFLHISKDEQLKRFKERMDDPTKQWKVNIHDYKERAKWDQYTEAFEDMLGKCSTKRAPWFIVPANHKWFRNLVVSQIVVDYLEGLKMQFPKPKDVEAVRRKYFSKR